MINSIQSNNDKYAAFYPKSSVAQNVYAKPMEADSVELSKNKDKKTTYAKYTATAVAGVALVVAIFKRKQISEFFSKIFKSEKNIVEKPVIEQPKPTQKPRVPETPTVKKPAFPEPKFTCGPENPEQYAKQKQAYIESISEYIDYVDKPTRIKALEAIEKYGTYKDCERLGMYLGIQEEDLIRPFVKTITAIGRPIEDSFYILKFLISPKYKLSNEAYKDIFNGLEKLGVDSQGYPYLPRVFKKVAESSNDELASALTETLCKISTKDNIPELRKNANHENPVVRESVAKIIEHINSK